MALRTDERGLEEAVKRVDDHRVVPPAVVAPSLLGHFLRDRKENGNNEEKFKQLGGLSGETLR